MLFSHMVPLCVEIKPELEPWLVALHLWCGDDSPRLLVASHGVSILVDQRLGLRWSYTMPWVAIVGGSVELEERGTNGDEEKN